MSHLTTSSLASRQDERQSLHPWLPRVERNALPQTGGQEEVDGAATAPAQGANDERAGLPAELLLDGRELLLDIRDELAFVRVRLDLAQPALPGALDLLGKRERADGGAGEPGVVAKRGDAAAALVLEELEVVQHGGGGAGAPAGDDVDPAALALVAVGEHDVRVRERGRVVLGQLLEADDGRRERRRGPRVVLDEGAPDAAQHGSEEVGFCLYA